MANTDLSMPVAVPPSGADPATFYATFAGRLTALWQPATGLSVWLAADPLIARLHAPMKSAMRFAPAGALVGGNPIPVDTVFLQTWPVAYPSIKSALQSAVPSEIRMGNVDPMAVRDSVTPVFSAIGRSNAAVDAFMAGNGLLLVEAGTAIGAAASEQSPPSPATPNRVQIEAFDASGAVLNSVQFFSKAAEHSGVDQSLHPLLSQLSQNDWVEIIVLDESGAPLAGEPYVLYLGDGTSRTGFTDAVGRIFETSIPPGSWGLDLPNNPAVVVQTE